MSLITDGFTLLGNLKVPAVGGATSSDTPLLIKNADFTAAMIASLKADGGDLRISTDSAGLNRLPIDVVDNLDVIWTLVPSVAVDTLIYIWGNDPAATQPAVGAAFGRNAVHSNESFRYEFENAPASGLEDRTSNSNDGTIESTVGTGAGKIGQAWDFDGVATAVRVPDSTSLDWGTSGFTVSAWIKPTQQTASGGARIINTSGKGSNTSKNGWQLKITDATTGWKFFDCGVYDGVNATVIGSAPTTVYPYNQWHFVTMAYDYATATLSLYADGSLDTSLVDSSTNVDSANDLIIGASRYNANVAESASQVFEGLIDSVSGQAGAKATNQISIEYQNQSATDSWWIAEDAASSIVITESLNTLTLTSSSPTIDFTGLVSVTESVKSINTTTYNPVVNLTATLTITESEGAITLLGLDPNIVLTPPNTIVVNESSETLNLIAFNPVITFSGTVSITEESNQILMTGYSPTIAASGLWEDVVFRSTIWTDSATSTTVWIDN